MTDISHIDAPHDSAGERLPGLVAHEGLDEVEACMVHLAVGSRLDRLGRMVQEHLNGGGRRIRARLALAAAEALGVSRSASLGWAAACELLHNAALIHDDLQDGDRVRRGYPSLWARHGAAQAVNAGDLLLMLPTLALERLDIDDARRWRLARAIASRAERAVRGQALELDLVGRRRLDWHAWAIAAEGKSGALLALPVEGAAILAGLAMPSVNLLAGAFAQFGLLYQIHDDVLDLWGDKGREQRGNDLREGKPSAVVATHLELHPGDLEDVVAVLEKPRAQTTDEEVEALTRRFEVGGALKVVGERIAMLESRVLEDPVLKAVPNLHGLAEELVTQLRGGAPTAVGRF